MTGSHSDALVFFGATGDLAYKKIFPALQAMLKRGSPGIPIIGVAKAGWTLDQLRARARESLERHGGFDPEAGDRLCKGLAAPQGTVIARIRPTCRPGARGLAHQARGPVPPPGPPRFAN